MFKALKMKIAARRLNKKTGKRANKKKTNVRKSTLYGILSVPRFVQFGAGCARFGVGFAVLI